MAMKLFMGVYLVNGGGRGRRGVVGVCSGRAGGEGM